MSPEPRQVVLALMTGVLAYILTSTLCALTPDIATLIAPAVRETLRSLGDLASHADLTSQIMQGFNDQPPAGP